jgi:hypothetical protein
METQTGNQLTVLWHVDDLKISCRDKFEVTRLICYLKGIYGDNITVHRGGKGEYLGMLLDFTTPGVFQVDMSRYVEEILSDFPESVKKLALPPTPTSSSKYVMRTMANSYLKKWRSDFIGARRNCCFCPQERERTYKRQYLFSQHK